MSPCDTVAERVALGEPLDELADHAAGCPRCRGLVALPAELAVLHHEADPGLGFASRLTAGAQQRLVSRHRRRVAAGVAGVLAAAALVVVVVTRPAAPDGIALPALPQPAVATNPPAHPDPWDGGQRPPAIDPDVAALVHLARAAHAHHHARWSHLERPLAPYRALVQGVSP